jgi:hypothetical protein
MGQLGTKNAKRRVTPRKSFLSQIGFCVKRNLRMRASYTCWQFSTRVGRSAVSNMYLLGIDGALHVCADTIGGAFCVARAV